VVALGGDRPQWWPWRCSPPLVCPQGIGRCVSAKHTDPSRALRGASCHHHTCAVPAMGWRLYARTTTSVVASILQGLDRPVQTAMKARLGWSLALPRIVCASGRWNGRGHIVECRRFGPAAGVHAAVLAQTAWGNAVPSFPSPSYHDKAACLLCSAVLRWHCCIAAVLCCHCSAHAHRITPELV
jgi:hypothetical protein